MNKDTNVLVTGGTGFAGSHLVEALLDAGYTNIHVTSLSGKLGSLEGKIAQDHVHSVDLTSYDQVATLLQKLQPQHIYHLAAHAVVGSSFEQGQQVLENNLKLQTAVLDAVYEHARTARLLVIGSGMEYDFIAHNSSGPINELHPLGPVSPYAVSKVIQDLLALSYAYSYQLDIVRARPFNHTGERQTNEFAIPAFAEQIAKIEKGQQTEISVGNLDAVRDFTDVKDVVRAYILLMEKGQTREVYNIGSGQGHTMQEMLNMMSTLSEVEVKIVTDPNKVRPLDVPAVVADISKIKQLGWEPTIPLQETLQRILIEWRART